MIRRLTIAISASFLATFILFVSIYKSASIKYSFDESDMSDEIAYKQVGVKYELPEDVKIMPNSPLWPLEVAGDQLEMLIAEDSFEKAGVMLSHADKRLVAGQTLVEDGNFSEGILVLSKAEKYLSQSYEILVEKEGIFARDLLKKINLASLKHREVLEKILTQSPEEGRSLVIETLDKPKIVYKESRVLIEYFGDQAPRNPFEEI